MCPTGNASQADADYAAFAQSAGQTAEQAPADANPGFRDAMLAALPSHAAAQKITPEAYPSWKAQREAEINAQTGWTPPDPAVAAEVQRAVAHAVAPNASATDYRPNFGSDFLNSLKDAPAVTGEMKAMAAALRLPSQLGNSLIERLANLAPHFRDVPPSRIERWNLDRDNELRRMYGDDAVVEAKLTQARKFLTDSGDKLAATLANSPQLKDPELLSIVLGVSDRWAKFQKGKS